MYKIYYKVRSAKRNGSGVVYVTIRCANLEEVTRTTGVSVVTKDFNATTGKVSVKDILHMEKNEVIRLLVVDLERSANNLTIQGRELTKAGIEAELPVATAKRLQIKLDIKELQDEIHNVILPDVEAQTAKLREELARNEDYLRYMRGEAHFIKRDLFVDRIDQILATTKALKEPSTKKSYEYLKSVIKRYNPSLQIQEINLSMLTGFQIWLATTVTKDGRNWRNGSILSVLTHLKAVYTHFADELNLPTAFFAKFKEQKVQYLANENVVYLTKDELEDFVTVALKGDLHIRVREQFLLLCYTGLRHIDGCIKRSDVFETKDRKGRKYKELRLNQDKTNTFVQIPLKKEALDILERNNYTFKKIPNNAFNQALKQIAEKVPSLQHDFTTMNFNVGKSIADTRPKWEFISSKVGRKTFVDYCFEEEVSETTVAAWLGHSNTNMVQKHYKHRGDIAKAEAHKILG